MVKSIGAVVCVFAAMVYGVLPNVSGHIALDVDPSDVEERNTGNATLSSSKN